MEKLIGILLLVALLLGCAAKNYSTMTNSELEQALSERQANYNKNATRYHQAKDFDYTTEDYGPRTPGNLMGSAMGNMINALSNAKAAQTDKQEMEKIQQELDRRKAAQP